VVSMVWIFSGGGAFCKHVGTSDVSSPTTASVRQTDVEKRTAEPAGASAQLESAPPDLGAASGRRGEAFPFRKEKASRPAKARAKAEAKRSAAAKAKARSRARKRQTVRVVAPPSDKSPGDEALPVAAVPSPAPTGTPAPAAAPPAKPAKPRTPPTYVAGAGEG